MWRKIALLLLPIMLTAQTSASEKFVGHYYLSGVREVGSELRLEKDGRYQWFLSYGAVDQMSDGRWKIVADEIVLTPDPKPTGKKPLTLGPTAPWDAGSELLAQQTARRERIAAIRVNCPFLPDETDLPAMSMPVSVMSKATQSQLDRARKALASEQMTRAVYERAAVAAMQPGADQADRHATARQARLAWDAAHDELLQADREASLPWRRTIEPKLPSPCQFPPEPTSYQVDDIPPTKWIRGVGVIIGDPKVRMRFSGFAVEFIHSDGHIARGITTNGGRAWAPLRSNAGVSSIRITIPDRNEGVLMTETFMVPNLRDTVQVINFDSGQFAPPAFDVLRLRIDGDDLVGPRDRGRYSRGP